MPEGSNVEIAHHLHERGGDDGAGGDSGHAKSTFERLVEIGEALLLAVVAVSTAYSGYQSARWDGRSAESYADASKLRVEQDLAATQAGQQLLYNTNNLDQWVIATTTGNADAADLFRKRFTDNYAVAFDAWLKTDPLRDPNAPAGPIFMPEYTSPLDDKAAKLDDQAAEAFDEGASARDTGEEYVRVTVFLALVLFLIAMSQRFAIRSVRVGLIGLGLAFLLVALAMLSSYPRI
jgi:hypothetical protein